MNFSKRLRELRKERKISQSSLGAAVHLTLKQIQRYESGESEPTLSKILAISDFFDVSVDYLLGTGIHGTLHKYPWLREPLSNIMDSYLEANGMDLHNTAELDEASFGDLVSAFFDEVQVGEHEHKKIVTLFPRIPVEGFFHEELEHPKSK